MASSNKFQHVFIITFLVALEVFVSALPLSDSEKTTTDLPTTTLSPNDTNDTQDLYVIRETVYEVGILTNDDGNDTDDSTTERNDKIQITYYNGGGPNGRNQIDLSKIPIPIQTNVSGQQFTGIIPAGVLQNFHNRPSDALSVVPILPQASIDITKNVSTTDPQDQKTILASLPPYFHLNNSIGDNNKNTTVVTVYGNNITSTTPTTIVKRSASDYTSATSGSTTTSTSSTPVPSVNTTTLKKSPAGVLPVSGTSTTSTSAAKRSVTDYTSTTSGSISTPSTPVPNINTINLNKLPAGSLTVSGISTKPNSAAKRSVTDYTSATSGSTSTSTSSTSVPSSNTVGLNNKSPAGVSTSSSVSSIKTNAASAPAPSSLSVSSTSSTSANTGNLSSTSTTVSSIRNIPLIVDIDRK